MEFRNLRYNRHGSIDCKINHPQFGWIDFTAAVDDPEPSTAGIYAAIMESEEPIAPYEPPEPEPPTIPDRVTARQFKLQLLADGLLASVEGWIATQDQAVQIAYGSSGTFLRTEPMMQAGFAALGFTDQQIDDFFVAAAAL